MGGDSKNKKIRDRVDSEGQYGRWKLWVMGSWSRQFITINGVQKQSMPIFEVRLDSLDNRASEQVEITGSKMEDFTTVRRPTVKEMKTKYEPRQGHIILHDSECRVLHTRDLG